MVADNFDEIVFLESELLENDDDAPVGKLLHRDSQETVLENTDNNVDGSIKSESPDETETSQSEIEVSDDSVVEESNSVVEETNSVVEEDANLNSLENVIDKSEDDSTELAIESPKHDESINQIDDKDNEEQNILPIKADAIDVKNDAPVIEELFAPIDIVKESDIMPEISSKKAEDKKSASEKDIWGVADIKVKKSNIVANDKEEGKNLATKEEKKVGAVKAAPTKETAVKAEKTSAKPVKEKAISTKAAEKVEQAPEAKASSTKAKKAPAEKTTAVKEENATAAKAEKAPATKQAKEKATEKVEKTPEAKTPATKAKKASAEKAIDAKNEKVAVAKDATTKADNEKKETVIVEGEGNIHGKFVIKKTSKGNFVFKLYSSNYRVIAIGSQPYADLKSCRGGINSVINNAEKAPIENQTLKKYETEKCPKWELYLDKKNEARLRLIASNGNIVATTNDGYIDVSGAKKGIAAIARACKGCSIVRNDTLW